MVWNGKEKSIPQRGEIFNVPAAAVGIWQVITRQLRKERAPFFPPRWLRRVLADLPLLLLVWILVSTLLVWRLLVRRLLLVRHGWLDCRFDDLTSRCKCFRFRFPRRLMLFLRCWGRREGGLERGPFLNFEARQLSIPAKLLGGSVTDVNGCEPSLSSLALWLNRSL